MAFQLVSEVAFAAEALAGAKPIAKIRTPARQPIQRQKSLRPETPCKSRTRQTQHLADCPHPHVREPIERLLRPA